MPLPSPTVPTFEATIPSSGKKIKYRPFLVKEEKVLLFAMESEPDENSSFEERQEWEDKVRDVVKDILKSCIISKVDLEDLASFDLEYIFLRIRAVSSGEDIQLTVTCRDDGTTTVPVMINLMDVEVKKPEGHTNKIMLTDTMGMIMKYPSVNQFIDITLLNKSLDDTDELFEMIADCVDQVFEGEEVWDSSDLKKSEILTFIEKMTQKQFGELEKFFTTMPILSHEFKVTNPNTKVESVYKLEGLQNFFG